MIFRVRFLYQFFNKTCPPNLSILFYIFAGQTLSHMRYEHLFEKGKFCPLVNATYIRGNVGTGLVHTAPAHGPDDFVTGLKYKLPLVSGPS